MIVKAEVLILAHQDPCALIDTLVVFSTEQGVEQVEVAEPIHYALMDGKPKRFFYAHKDAETNELIIDGEAPQEEW